MSERRLRILQLIPTLLVGGLERVATTLTLGLRERGVDVVVCTAGGEPFEQVLRDAGVPLVHVPRPRPTVPALARSAPALARAIRRTTPDVVHAHNPAAAVAAGLARPLARRRDLPLVTTYHGLMPHRLGTAARAMTFASDAIVGVGPSPTRDLEAAGVPSRLLATVLNAVDGHPAKDSDALRAELGCEGAELVVTVGRYATEKNHALLLDAVARLAALRPRLRVLLVGIGPLEAELRARIAALGLDRVVTLTGARVDAIDIAAAADVFVLSSASEGLPLSLLEAMAAGTAVVSTDVGGVADAVEDGANGLLVAPGDAAALAAAVERLLDDAELRSRLAAAGRAWTAAHCSTATMVDGYLELYRSVLDRRRG